MNGSCFRTAESVLSGRGGLRIPEKKVPGTGDQFGDEKDRASWKIGDVILRNVTGKVCRFRCIDDDYQDGSGNYGKRALFLAECVIRSDVESTYEERVLLSLGRIIIIRNPG